MRLIARSPALLLASLLALPACPECDVAPVEQLPPATEQRDVFEQRAAAEVDVLWVVDNSNSMADKQEKVAERFDAFLGELMRSEVDVHIGVVTTDPAERGVLRPYDGPAVSGCDGCRFLTPAVACPDPSVDLSGLDEAAISARLIEACPAQLVFRDLVRVGTDGAQAERAFEAAAVSLGVGDVDPATGLPRGAAPPENAGFLRTSASLYIVFVSDENEGEGLAGDPVRYYQRLFEALKGTGNENKVKIAAIAGYPDGEGVPPIDEACAVLDTTFDQAVGNDDPRAATLVQQLGDEDAGCTDGSGGGAVAAAEPGGRFMELACRTGGVVANICDPSYTASLNALGADAAGLRRGFSLSRAADLDRGPDCVALSGDERILDCDGDGSTGGTNDASVCVATACLNSTAYHAVIANDPVAGWQMLDGTSTVRFDGTCLPAPGAEVDVRYALDRTRPCG